MKVYAVMEYYSHRLTSSTRILAIYKDRVDAERHRAGCSLCTLDEPDFNYAVQGFDVLEAYDGEGETLPHSW